MKPFQTALSPTSAEVFLRNRTKLLVFPILSDKCDNTPESIEEDQVVYMCLTFQIEKQSLKEKRERSNNTPNR
jgi:hypothetical protein